MGFKNYAMLMQMNYYLIKLQKYPDTYDPSPGFKCH